MLDTRNPKIAYIAALVTAVAIAAVDVVSRKTLESDWDAYVARWSIPIRALNIFGVVVFAIAMAAGALVNPWVSAAAVALAALAIWEREVLPCYDPVWSRGLMCYSGAPAIFPPASVGSAIGVLVAGGVWLRAAVAARR